MKAEEKNNGNGTGQNETLHLTKEAESGPDRHLRSNLIHLKSENQGYLARSLKNSKIFAKLLDDLRPANVEAPPYFELENCSSVHHNVRRMAPEHDEVVRKEPD